MSNSPDDIKLYAESTAPTIFTPSVTTEDVVTKTKASTGSSEILESSVPWAGSSFIIRHAATGKVLTFQEGKICLNDIGGHYTFRWQCVEKKGWFGFRDPASHMFLGHDWYGNICCEVKHHKGYEEFCMRSLPEGGYNLLLKHGGELRPVGLKQDENNVLAQVENWSDALVWQFIKV